MAGNEIIAGVQDARETNFAAGAEFESERAARGFLAELSPQVPLSAVQAIDKSQQVETKAGHPELETDGEHEPDSESLDFGKSIYWSNEDRVNARPKAGEGYYEVMNELGKKLLDRAIHPDELKMLIRGARALQEQRGKNPLELSVHDELLPKNEEELEVFLNSMLEKRHNRLTERQVRQLQLNLYEAFQNQMQTLDKGELVYDLRPVKDQPVVTKEVPDAVYIDSSHIEGGQGWRRKENCEHETQEYWLSKSTAEAFMRAQKALVEGGHEPAVLRNMNAAGRRALDRELIKKCAPNQPHAKKRSTHEFGISIDVDNYDNLDVRKALEKEGFVRNVPGDRPHFTRR